MRSTPSNSDPDVSPPLTRQLQNWKWLRRAPVPEPACLATADAKAICLTTVLLGDVILDFESIVVVVGGHRIFPRLPHFRIAAALLFAEGEEVSAATLYAIRTGMAPPRANSLIARDIRHMRRTVFARDPRITIHATRTGYRLVWGA